MKVKMILPSLTEAGSPFWRPIKYSLFPPLGLATLAGHLSPEDDIEIVDEHVEPLWMDDRPDLVVIQVYITNACRAYAIADHYRHTGSYVILGGLHVTSLPVEASVHADTVCLGPGEDTFPRFLEDFRQGKPRKQYQSTVRTLTDNPPIRRDLIKRHLYLVPNSIVVSRGCPYHCDFCYKEAFFRGGRSFYTQKVDTALAEIENLPGRHLYFLDDHLFADEKFAMALFEGMKGMNRVFQAAGTIRSVLNRPLLQKASEAGLRSLFVGFETISGKNLQDYNKRHNHEEDYEKAVTSLHEQGIMINASFVFGFDGDKKDVFERTVDWAVKQAITTATFHILTPYPGTALYQQLESQQRIFSHDWELYDTRHAVFTPAGMTVDELNQGYWRAYKEFYQMKNILRGAFNHEHPLHSMKHFLYTFGWKKMEWLWKFIIQAEQLAQMRPVLETLLTTVKYPEKWIVSQVNKKKSNENLMRA